VASDDRPRRRQPPDGSAHAAADSDEKERSRRAREALEAADREAEIVLVRHAIDKLAAAKAVQASGNSGGAVRKRSAA